MSKSHTPRHAFSSEKGKQGSTVAKAWCAYLKNPETECHALAEALNARLLRLWPDGSGERFLHAHAAEVRQDTLLLTMGRYLANNAKLQRASQRADTSSIAREVERSLRGALNVVTLRMRRSARLQARRMVSLQDLDLDDLPSILHPTERRDFLALSPDTRLAVIMAGLRSAMGTKAVPARSAELLAKMLKEDLSLTDVARHLTVSRQAVHQILKPIRRFLRNYVEKEEFPYSEPSHE